MKLPNLFQNKHSRAIIYLIIANIIWGAASPIFKLALQDITPFTLAFIRFFTPVLIFLPFVASKLKIKKEDWSKIILIAFFGISINISFFFLGLQLAPSINAPIIGSSGPIFLYLVSITFLQEKPHLKVLAGTLISLFGVLIIIGQPILVNTADGKQILGNLFFLLATLGAVGHAVVSKEFLLKGYKPLTIIFWSFLIGSLTFLPFFVYETLTYQPLLTLDIRGYVGLIYGTIFSSAIAYTLYEKGLKEIDSQDIGIFTYIDPIVAILIALPLLGETISLTFAIGSLFVFLGIFIAEGRIHYHPFQKLRK